MVVFAMRNLANFDKALIVTSNGSFALLVDEFESRGKLRAVLSVKRSWRSLLLKVSAGGNIVFLDEIRSKLEKSKKRPADR